MRMVLQVIFCENLCEAGVECFRITWFSNLNTIRRLSGWSAFFSYG